MAKKSLSKIQIEMNDDMKAGVTQRQAKRAKSKSKKLEKESRDFIAAEMEGEV